MLARLAAAALFCVQGAAEAAAASEASRQVGAGDVAAWCDEVFNPMLEQRRFSGMAVVVVQNGEVLLARGYGSADVLRDEPFSPERTRLRIGSITKTMTATVIMQLLDEGRIRSLDDPANKYLRRYQLPDYAGIPVTVRELLTHTAGFEAVFLGLGTERVAEIPTNATYIRRVMPRQVRRPGGEPVYSNFGYQTLGAIVEDLTNQTMAEALTERVLQPVGMTQSILGYGLRPSPTLGQPYAFFPGGEPQAVPFVPLHPFTGAAGGVEATPADMAHYMLAHLDEDGAGERRILRPELLREMHRRHAGSNQQVPGQGLGFFVIERGGQRVVEHPGGWPGFYSLMTLLPDRKLGIFMSVMAASPVPRFGETLLNSARVKSKATPPVGPALSLYGLYGVREAFLNRFVGLPSVSFGAGDAERFAGTYLGTERNYTGPESVINLFGAASVVRAVSADAIEVDGDGPFYAIAVDSFAKRMGPPSATSTVLDRYGFPQGSAGELYRVDGSGLSVSERVGWLEDPALWRKYTLGAAFVCLSAVLLFRRRSATAGSRLAPWLPIAIVACLLTQALLLFAGFEPARTFFFDLLAGHTARLAALVILGNVMLALVLATIFVAIAAWHRRFWGEGRFGLLARLHYSLLALSAAGLALILVELNLFGVPPSLE